MALHEHKHIFLNQYMVMGDHSISCFSLKFVLCLCYYLSFFTNCRWINGIRSMPSSSSSSLQLQIQQDHVVLDNGVIGLTLSNPEGLVTEVRYNGIENVLEVRNEQDNRGYWDLNWAEPQSVEMYTRIMGTNFTLIKEDENQIEVSFTSIWNMSFEGKHVPLNIDRRFIMLSDCSGFYSYAIYEHLEGWPDFDLTQTRIAFKLREDMFQYMAISDERQRMMPMPEDRLTGLPLSYPEAVLLTNPTNPYFMGEVDDKYQYSSDNKDDRVHGWISSYPAIGFWIITPSDEFRAGGPFKQDLTCHVGPISLAMFVSRHYAGDDLDLKFREGPSWKKVLGPVFIYLNSVSEYEEPYVALWEDAKEQMLVEVQRWPYDFPVSEDFLCSDQRGTVSGRLLVQTNDSEYMRVDAAYVGLAPPGEVGSWQRESKGYQFWTKTDTNGSFSIVNARAGDYNLFAWVPGFIGDFRYDANLTVSPGCDINLGNIVYEPPRDGPTLWEIGIPDRSASEFYIPDPNPKYINKLYSNHLESDGYTLSSLDKFRQYGLWERYTDLYPDGDLIYTVGASYYRMDWFFAQFIRIKEDGTFQATTWKIKFKLEDVNQTGTYTLRLALASAAKAELQLPSFASTTRIHFLQISQQVQSAKTTLLRRHGIHGLYWLFNLHVPSCYLIKGENTIFLTQANSSDLFHGIMYDYIRLEGPRG